MEKNKSQIIIYQTENGKTKLDVRIQDETVWLTQKLMAELFQTSVPNINMHLKNIFEEGELEENRTTKEFLIVQHEGSREVKRKHIFLLTCEVVKSLNKPNCTKQLSASFLKFLRHEKNYQES